VLKDIAIGAGWFIHKRFLLPIGHARLGADGTTLLADLTKERVKRFPGFDKDVFERMTAENVRQLDAAIADACSSQVGPSSSGDDHYRVPDWWK
jgi:hypothetical protein